MNVTRRAINHSCRFKDYRASHRMERMEIDGANEQVLEKPFDDETFSREKEGMDQITQNDYKIISSSLLIRRKKAEVEQ